MKLNAKSEYALRAMLDLAARSGEQTTLSEIAARQNIPPAVLPGIFQILSRAGLVETVRGYGGGVRLGKSADEISLRMIFEALEGPLQLHRCDAMKGSCGKSHDQGCPLRSIMEQTEDVILNLWNSTTLADMFNHKSAAKDMSLLETIS